MNMKLVKAKEIMELNLKEAGYKMPADVRTALLLHIRAVDRLQLQRQSPDKVIWELLEGETPGE